MGGSSESLIGLPGWCLRAITKERHGEEGKGVDDELAGLSSGYSTIGVWVHTTWGVMLVRGDFLDLAISCKSGLSLLGYIALRLSSVVSAEALNVWLVQ